MCATRRCTHRNHHRNPPLKFSGSYFNIEGKGELHSECHEAYQLASAPRCFFCDEPVTSAGGKFSGSSYNIEGRGKLHEECYEAFKVININFPSEPGTRYR